MNRKLISDALGNINSAYITQSMEAPEKMAHRPPERTKTMGKFEKEKNRGYSRKLVSLILAACLVFALAITAYAANWFGIRELFRTYNRELPEAAEPYIQQHTETAATEDWSAPATEAETAPEDWSARVTESLCDASQILVTVNISGGDKYMLVPTDAMPQDTVAFIGLQGSQTLEEYAAEQGRVLLFVGATLMRNEKLGIHTESQIHKSIFPEEMTILIQSDRTGTAPVGDVICHVYAHNSQGEKKELDVSFTLSEAPTEVESRYVPDDPNAIPGLTIGGATVKETPLGISVRWMETVTDEDMLLNGIKKAEVEGIVFMAGGGTLQEDDGNSYFTASMGQGTVSDPMIVHFYDWDNQLIGDIVFRKK